MYIHILDTCSNSLICGWDFWSFTAWTRPKLWVVAFIRVSLIANKNNPSVRQGSTNSQIYSNLNFRNWSAQKSESYLFLQTPTPPRNEKFWLQLHPKWLWLHTESTFHSPACWVHMLNKNSYIAIQLRARQATQCRLQWDAVLCAAWEPLWAVSNKALLCIPIKWPVCIENENMISRGILFSIHAELIRFMFCLWR